MTPRKPRDPDAITRDQAAHVLGLTPDQVTRLRRHGLLVDLGTYPTYSLDDVLEVAADPWLDGVEAAKILGVSRTRVAQLAIAERIPSHVSPLGRRWYRQRQLEVVANARNRKWHSQSSEATVSGP